MVMVQTQHSIFQKLQGVMQKAVFNNSTGRNGKKLSKEQRDWFYNIRTACVHYIKGPHVYFDTNADTFAAAISVLDMFLLRVKVTQRHLSIVAVACFLIASKMMEEEEDCPSAKQLASLPGHNWTPKDLCRMEYHILSKLEWKVPIVSYLDFLPLFAKLYNWNKYDIYQPQVILLAERCLSRHSTILHQPTILALALVQLQTGLVDVSVTSLHSCMQAFCNIQERELERCRNDLQLLSSDNILSSQLSSSFIKITFPLKIFDKPSQAGCSELSTIEEDRSC